VIFRAAFGIGAGLLTALHVARTCGRRKALRRRFELHIWLCILAARGLMQFGRRNRGT